MFPVVFTETMLSVYNVQPKMGGRVLAIVPERRSPRLLALISLMAIASMFGLGSSSADEGGASFCHLAHSPTLQFQVSLGGRSLQPIFMRR